MFKRMRFRRCEMLVKALFRTTFSSNENSRTISISTLAFIDMFICELIVFWSMVFAAVKLVQRLCMLSNFKFDSFHSFSYSVSHAETWLL